MSSKVVAQVGNQTVSAEAFQSYLDTRAGGSTNQFQTVQEKAALLEELIRRAAIVAKASAAGFDQRPEIQSAIQRLIAGRYEEYLTHAGTSELPSVSQTELQTYYQAHQEKYRIPAKARGSIIFFKVSKFAPAEKLDAIMAHAQDILAQAKTAGDAEFMRLVQANSEDQATRYAAGDIGWVSANHGSFIPNEVIEALLNLKTTDEFAPIVVTARGLYIVKLINAKPAGVRPLMEVKDAIRYTLQQQKRTESEQQFYASMKSGLNIQTNMAVLENMHPTPAQKITPESLSPVAQQ